MGNAISQRWAAFVLTAALAVLPVSAQTKTVSSNSRNVVSVDSLQHPIAPKVARLLGAAMEKMDSGDHQAAIAQLLETLTKYPASAAYVQSLLGVEYVRTSQFDDAIASFEQAVRLLPHDAMNHYNFGHALLCAGQYDRAEQEVERALALDPGNAQMQARLNEILEHRRLSSR